jgi:tetratricopeptide (TPR) repeat protein
MKKDIFIFLFVCLANISCAYAQTHTIDSLKHLLQTEKQDSERCLLLERLSDEYSVMKPDSALLMAQQGLALAKQINFKEGEVYCLFTTGDMLANAGSDAKALELLLQALIKSETINEQWLSGNILRSIANVYGDQGDWKKALEYNLMARDIAAAMHDLDRQMVCTINLGDNYEKLNQLDSARFFTEQGYDYAVKNRITYIIGLTLNNLGNIYSKMQQPAVAMGNYRLSLPYSLEENANDLICETTLGMAKLFRQQHQEDSCLYYARLSYAIAQKAGFIKYALNAGNFLVDYYKQHHVVDSAYAYLSVVSAAKDSMFSQEKIREIQSLSFDETMRQQEIAAGNTAEKLRHKNNLEVLGITAGILILIGLFFVLSQSFVVHERWIKFLGIIGLLVVFEYLYIFIDPYVIKITNESPLWMLLALVLIAVVLEPIHHRIEHWITHKMIAKNKQLRLAAAKRTVARLEAETNENMIKNS